MNAKEALDYLYQATVTDSSPADEKAEEATAVIRSYIDELWALLTKTLGIVDEVLQAEPDTKPCQWEYDGNNRWETSCENTFLFFAGGPQDNGFRFCPYCGGRLEVVR